MAFALASRQTAFAGQTRSAKAARSSVKLAAATPSNPSLTIARPLWLPGITPPAHLTGELAGDYGFDPLNLGRDPQALKWYQQAELIHGRTAMAAVAGILIPSALTKLGALNVPEWYEAGKTGMQGIPFATLIAVQLFLCGFVEVKRWQDFRKPGSQGEKGSFLGLESSLQGVENGYPGGLFDPLGLSKESPEKFMDYKIKEIKNGRLAMLAFLGFSAQYFATKKGPLDNLAEHLADPWNKTFVDNGVSVPGF